MPEKSEMTETETYTAIQNTTADTAPIQTAPGLQEGETVLSNTFTRDRRQSDEWDASKVPPSRFQKRKGSIYSTPCSRDGHIDRNYASKFHDLHTEKHYGKKA